MRPEDDAEVERAIEAYNDLDDQENQEDDDITDPNVSEADDDTQFRAAIKYAEKGYLRNAAADVYEDDDMDLRDLDEIIPDEDALNEDIAGDPNNTAAQEVTDDDSDLDSLFDQIIEEEVTNEEALETQHSSSSGIPSILAFNMIESDHNNDTGLEKAINAGHNLPQACQAFDKTVRHTGAKASPVAGLPLDESIFQELIDDMADDEVIPATFDDNAILGLPPALRNSLDCLSTAATGLVNLKKAPVDEYPDLHPDFLAPLENKHPEDILQHVSGRNTEWLQSYKAAHISESFDASHVMSPENFTFEFSVFSPPEPRNPQSHSHYLQHHQQHPYDHHLRAPQHRHPVSSQNNLFAMPHVQNVTTQLHQQQDVPYGPQQTLNSPPGLTKQEIKTQCISHRDRTVTGDPTGLQQHDSKQNVIKQNVQQHCQQQIRSPLGHEQQMRSPLSLQFQDLPKDLQQQAFPKHLLQGRKGVNKVSPGLVPNERAQQQMLTPMGLAPNRQAQIGVKPDTSETLLGGVDDVGEGSLSLDNQHPGAQHGHSQLMHSPPGLCYAPFAYAPNGQQHMSYPLPQQSHDLSLYQDQAPVYVKQENPKAHVEETGGFVPGLGYDDFTVVAPPGFQLVNDPQQQQDMASAALQQMGYQQPSMLRQEQYMPYQHPAHEIAYAPPEQQPSITPHQLMIPAQPQPPTGKKRGRPKGVKNGEGKTSTKPPTVKRPRWKKTPKSEVDPETRPSPYLFAKDDPSAPDYEQLLNTIPEHELCNIIALRCPNKIALWRQLSQYRHLPNYPDIIKYNTERDLAILKALDQRQNAEQESDDEEKEEAMREAIKHKMEGEDRVKLREWKESGGDKRRSKIWVVRPGDYAPRVQDPEKQPVPMESQERFQKETKAMRNLIAAKTNEAAAKEGMAENKRTRKDDDEEETVVEKKRPRGRPRKYAKA